jgi:hypothetical protein
VSRLKPSMAALAGFGICLWYLACVTGLRYGAVLPGPSPGASVWVLAVRLVMSLMNLSD